MHAWSTTIVRRPQNFLLNNENSENKYWDTSRIKIYYKECFVYRYNISFKIDNSHCGVRDWIDRIALSKKKKKLNK